MKINRENKKISQESNKKSGKNREHNKKVVSCNKGKIIFKRGIIILLGIATIFTILVFGTYKTKFTFNIFFLTIFFCFICEVVLCGAIGMVIELGINYIKRYREQGILKATIWLIVVIIMVALFIYNKDAKWFRK